MKARELIELLREHDLEREVVVSVDNFYVPAQDVSERTNVMGTEQVVIE